VTTGHLTLTQAIATTVRQVAGTREGRPLDWIRLTDPQLEYVSDDAQIALLRGGNQLGKTLAGHYDLLHTARGTHPFRKTPPPPLNLMVLSESWEQMGQAGGFMEKLWALTPKDEIDPKIRFDPGRGISGKPPRIVFTSGPGKGTVITFATYRQGAARLAGSTVHGVWLDEPPDSTVYEEVVPRLLRHGGLLRIMFTPVLDMPDMAWLRQLVASGQVSEHNPRLCEASCWPRGAPVPWLPQRKIDTFAALLPASIRAMRVEGAWDPVYTDRYLTAWDPERHLTVDAPPPGAYLCVGLDHGALSGKQRAALVAIWGRDTIEPVVWVVDEVAPEGITSPADDARAILEMLSRRGLTWRDIDLWIGDRLIGDSRYLVRKSNAMVRRQLAYQAKVPLPDWPHMATPAKWAGSVESGLDLINGLMATHSGTSPHFRVHPRCAEFTAFCEKFNGNSRDPLKDIGDAVRYPVERAIIARSSVALTARY
jgi:phage terminase large subunit-like protein